jgi:hypothetical protein
MCLIAFIKHFKGGRKLYKFGNLCYNRKAMEVVMLLTLALDDGKWLHSHSRCFSPGEYEKLLTTLFTVGCLQVITFVGKSYCVVTVLIVAYHCSVSVETQH